jgi:hypothetical protein
MKRMSITRWLVAVLVVSAGITAQSASALPVVGRCVAQPGTGHFKESQCLTAAKKAISEKQYEFFNGAGTGWKRFTVEGGGTTFETLSGTTFSCNTTHATGEYNEVSGVIKEVKNVAMSFLECMFPLIDAECKTAGAAGGEVITSSLKGKLGYISGKGAKPPLPPPVVGLELTPVAKKGPFLAFECAGGALKIEVGEGSGKGGNRIIAPITEVNRMSNTFTETYAEKEGKQEPQSFQGIFKLANLEERTNGGAWEPDGLEGVITLTNEQELEIKA